VRATLATKPARRRPAFALVACVSLAALGCASTGARSTTTATQQAPPALFRAGIDAAFARFTRTIKGSVELAVAPLGSGPSTTLGGDDPAHAWSTSKVPVLVALLRARGSLSDHQRSLARLAITQSDNQSVLDLFGDLERAKGGLIGASRYIDAVLRAGGDAATRTATAPPPPGAVTTFGQTLWRPTASARFFRALGRGCLLPAAQSAYVTGLMEQVEPAESWGLGAAGFAVPVAFKGGWGPEPTGYLVRQSGIIAPGTTRGVAVSIVARARDGSFAGGTQILTQTARWLRFELRLIKNASAVGLDCSRSS
jgi:hypothetical protein